MTPCACTHARWVHLGYVGSCGLCSCTAFREPAFIYSTTTNATTEVTP